MSEISSLYRCTITVALKHTRADDWCHRGVKFLVKGLLSVEYMQQASGALPWHCVPFSYNTVCVRRHRRGGSG